MRVVLRQPTTAGACTGHAPRKVRRGHCGSDPLLRATQRRPRRGPSRARAAARRLSDGALGEHYAVLTLDGLGSYGQAVWAHRVAVSGRCRRAPERTRGRRGRAQGSAQTPPAQRVLVLTPAAQRVLVLTVDRCNALQRSPVQRRPGATPLQRVSHSEAKPQAVPTLRESRPTDLPTATKADGACQA